MSDFGRNLGSWIGWFPSVPSGVVVRVRWYWWSHVRGKRECFTSVGDLVV